MSRIRAQFKISKEVFEWSYLDREATIDQERYSFVANKMFRDEKMKKFWTEEALPDGGMVISFDAVMMTPQEFREVSRIPVMVPEEPGWRPMDTAPKYGWILLKLAAGEFWHDVQICMWYNNGWLIKNTRGEKVQYKPVGWLPLPE